MPDFEKMTDKALREWKSKKHHELLAIRDEMREANKVLEAKRAAADKEQAEQARADEGADAVAEAEAIVTSPGASASGESIQGG